MYDVHFDPNYFTMFIYENENLVKIIHVSRGNYLVRLDIGKNSNPNNSNFIKYLLDSNIATIQNISDHDIRWPFEDKNGLIPGSYTLKLNHSTLLKLM